MSDDGPIEHIKHFVRNLARKVKWRFIRLWEQHYGVMLPSVLLFVSLSFIIILKLLSLYEPVISLSASIPPLLILSFWTSVMILAIFWWEGILLNGKKMEEESNEQ